MMRLSEIAQKFNATIVMPAAALAEADPAIHKLAPIEYAKAGELSFISNPDYAKFAATTKAAAILVKQAIEGVPVIQLVVANPYLCFAKAANWFYAPPALPEGISQQAYVDPDASVGEGVSISPFAYIGRRVTLGKNVVIHPGVYIGEGCDVGDNTIVYANTVIYHGCKIGKNCIIHAGAVIGADGFGYAVTKDETVKIPQVGIVVIEDDVEIGACATVDRAAMGVTRVGKGSKLDSRVQVGHNVEIGERCMLSAFVGLAGSCKLGDRVTMGGHSGVNGHVSIASDTRIGGMSAVVKTIDQPGEYIGFPAVPAMQWRRAQVHIQRLGDYEKRLRSLEKRLLEAKE